MASAGAKGFSGALGGAGTGAAIGSVVPGIGTAIGAIGGGIVGGLAGLFSGSDPDISSPQYADINLANDNPDLFKRLAQQDALIAQAQQLYDNRRASITANEKQGYDAYMSDLGRSIASGGLAGTSDGYAQANKGSADYMNKIGDRIYQEQLGLFKNLQDSSQAGYNMDRQALNDVLRAKAGQFDYQNQQNQASDKMWSSLIGAGASGLGAMGQMGMLGSVGAPNLTTGSLPQGYSYGVPGQGLNYVAAPSLPSKLGYP